MQLHPSATGNQSGNLSENLAYHGENYSQKNPEIQEQIQEIFNFKIP